MYRQDLEQEVDRFLELVAEPEDTLRCGSVGFRYLEQFVGSLGMFVLLICRGSWLVLEDVLSKFPFYMTIFTILEGVLYFKQILYLSMWA